MFKDCPLKDCIVPILNDKNLDEVFKSIGFDIDYCNKPESYRHILNTMEPDDLLDKLKGCDRTNMDMMIEEVLSHSPDYQGGRDRMRRSVPPSARRRA